MSKQAEELCAGVRTLHDEAVELADSVLFMAKKLKEERKAMEKEPAIIEYDNCGGQSGIRENPHFTAYEKLLTTYSKALRLLTEIIEKGAPSSKKASSVMKELAVVAGKKAG